MKRVLLGLVATSLLAAALPAAAQSYSQGGYGAPSYGSQGYGSPGYGDRSGYGQDAYGQDAYGRGDFSAQIERLTDRVRRGLLRGEITSWQGRRLFTEIGGLRQLERRYRYNGLDGRERMDLQARLGRVRYEIRGARGSSGYGGGGYGDGGYDNGDDNSGYDNDSDDNDGGYWSLDFGDRGPRR